MIPLISDTEGALLLSGGGTFRQEYFSAVVDAWNISNPKLPGGSRSVSCKNNFAFSDSNVSLLLSCS
jgi:hypothetical protein